MDHVVNNAGTIVAEQLEDCVDISAPRSVMVSKLIFQIRSQNNKKYIILTNLTSLI